MFLNTSRTRVNKNNLSWWYILKTSWKYLCMSWRRLQHVLKTSLTLLEDIFARHLEDVLKTSSVEVRLRRAYSSCSRRLEDVLKTSSEDKDVRRLQDECLLVGFFLYTLKIFWKDQKIRCFFMFSVLKQINQLDSMWQLLWCLMSKF